MGALPKVMLCFLLGAVSLHQSEGMVSIKPFWKGWPLVTGFRHQNALQGPLSFGLSILNDFDDMWPLSLSSDKMHPMRAMQTGVMQVPQGSWVKIEDEKDETEKQFDCEEQQLQLKENQLRKERQDLKSRREEHVRQEEQRKHQLEQKRMDERRKHQQVEEQMRREEQLRLAKIQQQQREQEKRKAQIRQQREDQLRVEEQIRKQNELQKQERERREELRLREEKRQLEKQRLLLERERQERIRREAEQMERQRANEEREMRRRQQEEAHQQRRMEERRWHEEQDHQETSRHKAHQNNLPRSEFGKINIPEGYNLEDITIQTIGNQAFVKGYHLCKCNENCYEREFERRVQVPKNVDTRTITGSLYPNGVLSLQGVRYIQNVIHIDTSVDLEGVGLAVKNIEDDSCNKMKSGIKLRKMNARTGEIFDDVAPLEDKQPTFETEVDKDGLTIEVEE